jgi:class 3 adenylate cyclase
VRCALALLDAWRALGIEARAGLHVGECEMLAGEVRGIAVHLGARVAALAGAGEVLATSTVRDLVAGSGLRFADRGLHDLKGVDHPWHLYAASAG